MATSIALAAAFIHLALATPLLRRESPASLVPPVLGSLAARSQPHHTTTKHISTAELDCDHPLWSETNIDPCSGHGRCAMTKRGGEDRRCACSPGWRGRRCAQQACLRSCGAHGRCARSGDALACACDVGWSGERCALRQCPVAADGTVCAHHGKCVDGAFATGGSLCFCLAGWTGVDCGKRLCPLGASSSDGELAPCSGRGVCNGDPSEPKCHCLPSFGGAACEIDACAGVNSCSGHGECTGNNECDCAPNWYGESCALPGCPERCNGISHGECIPDSNEPGAGTPRTFHCACREGWAGPSCAVQACPRGCGAGASHGWCRDAVRSAGEETEAGGYALTAPSRANLHAAQVLGAARFCACAPRWAGRGCSKRDGRVQTELVRGAYVHRYCCLCPPPLLAHPPPLRLSLPPHSLLLLRAARPGRSVRSGASPVARARAALRGEEQEPGDDALVPRPLR